jgi:predicted lipoprotein with Yx(FWY)xxD motif
MHDEMTFRKPMKRREKMKTFYRLLLAGAMMVPAFGNLTAQDENVKILKKDNKTVGAYLTDDQGRTIYWKKGDSPDKSTCSGPCLEVWPLVNLPATLNLPKGLKASEFSRIRREDGNVQSTFRRYPLYYYSKDAAAGDTNGQGINAEWYVINPDTFPPVKPPVKIY